MEARVVKAMHRRYARRFSAIIDKRAVAFRDQEQAFDVSRRILGEMVLQVDDSGSWREVADP